MSCLVVRRLEGNSIKAEGAKAIATALSEGSGVMNSITLDGFALPVKQLKGGSGSKAGRPAWFDATIVAALEPRTTRYAGHHWPVGPVYQVH